MFKRICSLLNLSYKDSQEEAKFNQINSPFVTSFVKFLCFALTFLLIPYAIRYYKKDLYYQSFTAIGLVVISAIFFLFSKKLAKYIEYYLLAYLIGISALGLTVFHEILIQDQTIEAFYMGYSFGLIHRLVGYRFLRLKYMIVLHIASIIAKLTILGRTEICLTLIVVCLECFTILLSYKSEKSERKLFDCLYKSEKDTLKFKHMITEYFPNPLAIFSIDFSNALYINNSFQRSFRSVNTHQIKSVMEKLIIEKEVIERNKLLFTKLGKYGEDCSDMSFSKFIQICSSNLDIVRNLGTLSIQVIESDDRCKEVQAIEEDPLAKKLKVQESKIPKKKSFGGSFLRFIFNRKEKPNSNKHTSPTSARDPLQLERNRNSLSISKTPSNSSVSDISSDEEKKGRVFKAKIFLLIWDESEVIAVVLDDATKQKTISDLKQSDKNKDLVIAMVSHELRTPLNGMLGIIDIIKKTLKQTEVLPLVNACKNSAILLLNLVNSILDLSLIKNNKIKLVYTKVSVNDLMNDIKMLFGHFCEMKDLFLSVLIDPDVKESIVTDRNRLSQILINLLGNAFKFTFNGGVTVRVDADSKSPYKLKFSIHDTGIGIKKEDQAKLFKIFGKLEQEDRKINTNGVGLGLTISNTLVRLLNPTDQEGIRLESEPGQGSTFTFSIEDRSDVNMDQDNDILSIENIDSTLLDEDHDLTIFRKISANTLGHIENFGKISSYSQNLELNNNFPLQSQQEIKRSLMFGTKEGILSSSGDLEELRVMKPLGEISNLSSEMAKFRLGRENKTQKSTFFKQGEDSSKGKPFCLVVDDNPFNLMVASHLMEERGYQVRTALNGKDAIEKVLEQKENHKAFQIILMDCQMPVMDGYEATRILKGMMRNNEIKECPILAVTANIIDEEHERLCEQVGMSGCVGKPLQVEDLGQTLKKIKKKIKDAQDI